MPRVLNKFLVASRKQNEIVWNENMNEEFSQSERVYIANSIFILMLTPTASWEYSSFWFCRNLVRQRFETKPTRSEKNRLEATELNDDCIFFRMRVIFKLKSPFFAFLLRLSEIKTLNTFYFFCFTFMQSNISTNVRLASITLTQRHTLIHERIKRNNS